MRKFSEFGYCCGLAGVAVSPASNPVAAAAIRQRTGSSTAPNRRYSRTTTTTTDPLKKKPRSSALWSPSLSVISEHGLASRGEPEETRRKKFSQSGDEETSRSPLNGGSKRKSCSSTSMAMPAFSPTPFMF